MATGPSAAASVDQRTRILDVALTLMGDQGAQPTSMRQLANACGINVATLYHYFPSKTDLIRAVIEERRYSEHLAATDLPVARRGSPRARLAALLRFLGTASLAEETVWRLILGEAVHNEPAAVGVARQLTADVAEALHRWLPELLPEYGGDLDALVTVLRSQLLAMLVEVLIHDGDPRALIAARAEDMAAVALA